MNYLIKNLRYAAGLRKALREHNRIFLTGWEDTQVRFLTINNLYIYLEDTNNKQFFTRYIKLLDIF